MKPLTYCVFLATACFFLSGCGDKAPKTTLAGQGAVKIFKQPTILEGTVGNGKALIKTGTVEIVDEHGKTIAQTQVDNGRFRVEIPAGTALPLVLNFNSTGYDGTLSTVAVDPNINKYYIDPNTTAIAKAAKAMGGYTRANLVRAAEETTHAPDANKTTTGWRGDPTTQYGGWH